MRSPVSLAPELQPVGAWPWGLILMAVLEAYKVTGALLIGILAVTAASVGSEPRSPARILRIRLDRADLRLRWTSPC